MASSTLPTRVSNGLVTSLSRSLSTFRGDTGGVAAGDFKPGPRDLLSQDLLAFCASGAPNAIAVCATSPPAGPAVTFAACTATSAIVPVRLPDALCSSCPWLLASGRVQWRLSSLCAGYPLLPWLFLKVLRTSPKLWDLPPVVVYDGLQASYRPDHP